MYNKIKRRVIKRSINKESFKKQNKIKSFIKRNINIEKNNTKKFKKKERS